MCGLVPSCRESYNSVEERGSSCFAHIGLAAAMVLKESSMERFSTESLMVNFVGTVKSRVIWAFH